MAIPHQNSNEIDWIDLARTKCSSDAIIGQAELFLRSNAPSVFSLVDTSSLVRLYGLDSGFFYMPMGLHLFSIYSHPEIDVPSGFLEDLSTSIALGHAHFAIMDKIIDERVVKPPLIPVAQICLSIYLKQLETLYEGQSVRDRHDHYYQLYAVQAIREHRSRFQLVNPGTHQIQSLGLKSAPACVALELILKKTGHDAGYIVDATEIFLQYAGCLQLLDDLSDLEPDFRDGLSSFPLNMLFVYGLGLTEWPCGDRLVGNLSVLAVLTRTRLACLTLARRELISVLNRATKIALTPIAQASSARLATVEQQIRACHAYSERNG